MFCTDFADVPTPDPDYGDIGCVTCLGAIAAYECGYEAGEPCLPPANAPYFRPHADVTRGQAARLVAVVAGFSDDPGPSLYADVPEDHPCYTWINRLSNCGHMSGFACGGAGEPCVPPGNRPYFRPAGPITRAQLAKIVSNAADFSDDPGPQVYEDVPVSSTFYDWIMRLTLHGAAEGYPVGSRASRVCRPRIGPTSAPR